MSSSPLFKICVTGAAGNISNHLIPYLCNGSVFPDKQISLSLLDIPNPPQISIMNGTILELQDCNYPNLHSVTSHTNASEAFKDADLIIFLGGYPRKPGMERKDLLSINGKIFTSQAEALQYAKADVKCLIIANPCNTNAKILYEGIKTFNLNIKRENITCLSRLDQNRARSLYKQMHNANADHVFIWGNHSSSCVPDVVSVNDEEKELINEEFITKVQQRGSEILTVKGMSSVFSAAKAICDHLRDWCYGSTGTGTTNNVVSMGVVSNGEYDIKEGLVCSMPCKCTGNWEYKVIQGLQVSNGVKRKLDLSVQELEDEANEII